jgi:hypothetical protein
MRGGIPSTKPASALTTSQMEGKIDMDRFLMKIRYNPVMIK